MTEDINDQSTGQPAGGPEEETAPIPVAETTGEAIALPAAIPPPSAGTPTLPQQPDTAPDGVAPGVPRGVPLGMAHEMTQDMPQDVSQGTPPQGMPAQDMPLGVDPVTAPGGVVSDAPAASGSTPPQGSYAMGALAGNPMLGETPAAGAPFSSYAPGASTGGPSGPPTDPHGPVWAPPVAGAKGSGGEHKFRNGVLAGAAAVAVLAAGVGIGAALGLEQPHQPFRHRRVEQRSASLWLGLGLRRQRLQRFRQQPLRQRLPLRWLLGKLGQHRRVGLVELGFGRPE